MWLVNVSRVMGDCQREFCSKCGNKTLSRVTVSYNDDGSIQYFLSRHKTFSTRGLRVSRRHAQHIISEFYVIFKLYWSSGRADFEKTFNTR